MVKNEIIIYQNKELSTNIEVKVENETIWLTQSQIVILFDSSRANISEHIKHIYQTGELIEEATIRKFRTVQLEGNRKVSRLLIHYNLDLIISVGYRVNSIQGTQFRIWANQIIKDFLLKGYAINNRIDRLEDKLIDHDKKFEILLNTNLPTNEGIFYDGQIFDAYAFVSKLIKSANKSIIIIDNYVDESVLLMLSKRKTKVSAKIFTSKISKQLKLDLDKYNSQYPEIIVNIYKKTHDRFIIIDNEEIYHIGASLKDLGKKLFAFSKMDIHIQDLLLRFETNE